MTEVLRYEEPVVRWRFLLSDGRVVDVDAVHTNSNMRAWLLEQLGTKDLRIEGVAEVPAQEPLS